MKRRYNLTGSQNFYGIKDAKTYYSVPPERVWGGFHYMCETFNLANIFVYDQNTNEYIGSYSHKYKNFTTANNQRHKSFNF